MKHPVRRWGEAVALVMFLSLAISFGCSKNESSGPPTVEVTPGWKQLFTGQAADPAYGPPGSAADGLLAYSSFRSLARADSSTAHQHIWIEDLTDTTFHSVTSGSYDEYDPAWSPDGKRLAFTRDNGSRRDVFWVDVSSPSAPGTPIQLTDRTFALTGASDPGWITVGGEQQVTFSDGKDLWRIPLSGGSPIKFIPDPVDVRPIECGGVNFEDLDAVSSPTGTRVAVVSLGRLAIGAVHIVAHDSLGAPVVAKLWLSPCDSLAVTGTEATFTNLPVGDYDVRGFIPGGTGCDTLDVPTHVGLASGASDTASVTLNFRPTTASLLVRTIGPSQAVGTEFFYFLDCLPTTVVSSPISPLSPLDSLVFTPVNCVPPGLHVVGGTQGERIDTAWVNVVAGQIQRVTLQFLDSVSVDTMLAGTSMAHIYPRGGEGTFYTRKCQGESLLVLDAGSGDSVWGCFADTTVHPPVAQDWTYNWAVLDTICGGTAGGTSRYSGAPRFPSLHSALAEEEGIWVFDSASGNFVEEVSGNQVQNPVWDPTGRNRIAYIYRATDHWGIGILNLDTDQSTYVGLPGRTGPFVCVRDAIGLSWSPDGRYLAVAVSPCGGGAYPTDLQIWTADLTAIGAP